MIVVTLNVCPPALRGDLTQWLFEINTGVYVGNVSARVRDKLWQRICDHVKDGRATMVFSTNNEQRFDFRVHNTNWQPVDYDGLKLMMRPAQQTQAKTESPPAHFSHAAKIALGRKAQRNRRQVKRDNSSDAHVFIDLETTGLSEETAHIIEVCAMEVEHGTVLREYHAYIRQDEPIPKKIVQLTGITDEILQTQGISQKEALEGLLKLLGKKQIISHNIRFDMRFLGAACRAEQLPVPDNPALDTLPLAKELIQGLPNYRLSTVAKHLQISVEGSHTSHGDCLMTSAVYEALLRLKQSQ